MTGKDVKSWNHIQYDAVGQESPDHQHDEQRTPPRFRMLLFLLLSHIATFVAGMSLYRLCGPTTLQPTPKPLSLTPKLESIVPEALQAFSKTVRFNGTLDFPSIYRGRGPEVDNAWNWLTGVGVLNLDVTPEQLEDMGIDEQTVARYPDGKYSLSIETFHQIHCVDLLRKVTFYNYEYYSARPDEDASFKHPEQMTTHVDHCIEMLRQNLICQADPTLLSYHNVAVRRHMPWPNFNTVHQCRDFDAIWHWARKVERKPEGDTVVPEDEARVLAVPP